VKAALKQAKSSRVQDKDGAHRDLEREGTETPLLSTRPRRWSVRRKLTVTLIAIAVAAAIAGVVAVSLPPPIPSSLPIPAGTVFPLPVARLPNGTALTYNRSFVYYWGFSAGSVTAPPPGLCLRLLGAWRATAPTLILGAQWQPWQMNGTMNLTIVPSAVGGAWLGFQSYQPDTITVTQTIQWVTASCP